MPVHVEFDSFESKRRGLLFAAAQCRASRHPHQAAERIAEPIAILADHLKKGRKVGINRLGVFQSRLVRLAEGML